MFCNLSRYIEDCQSDAIEWLWNIAPSTVSIRSIVDSIHNPLKNQPKPNLFKINLSTAQQYDEWHWNTLLPKLNDEELFQVPDTRPLQFQ